MDEQPGQDAVAMTVAQVARHAGITVRTLHHYDRIGLLVPSARSDAGYRLYDAADRARLAQVLVLRRLDVPLEQIAAMLDDPQLDRRAVLERQRTLVADRIEQLHALALALDTALESEQEHGLEHDMATDKAIIDALGGFDPADHADEARERWGDTDAYRESARRTKGYGPEQWRAIKAEADELHERLAAAWSAGADPASSDALALADAWRAHVTRWFYPCSPEFLRGLGEMYVADPRFTAAYDGADGERAGMAAWVRDVWIARADAG